jgi:hypothetical protein
MNQEVAGSREGKGERQMRERATHSKGAWCLAKIDKNFVSLAAAAVACCHVPMGLFWRGGAACRVVCGSANIFCSQNPKSKIQNTATLRTARFVLLLITRFKCIRLYGTFSPWTRPRRTWSNATRHSPLLHNAPGVCLINSLMNSHSLRTLTLTNISISSLLAVAVVIEPGHESHVRREAGRIRERVGGGVHGGHSRGTGVVQKGF